MSHKDPTLVTIERPILTPEQEQEKWLGEALRNVKEKSERLKAAMKRAEFVNVLKAASQVLGELRTGMLTPQHYYELYSAVFDELQGLEFYFEEEVQNGRTLEDLYETVQHAGNIVPRLYLLITVGVIYIKSKKAPPRELIKDLVEMCKGVQHPTRGLFLRHYLLTKVKNYLPDEGNEYFGEESGNVEDSASFILQNFKEMVWLWVRMEKCDSQLKNRREKERRELRVLVGFNLVRLSQLEGIDKHGYQQVILPRILNIILSFKEPLAQEYLLGVIVQVFPDEFHLYTLSDLLLALGSAQVVAGVNIHSILTLLMDRLGQYVAGLRDGTVEGGSKKEEKIIKNMFTVFREKIEVITSSTNVVFSQASYAETQSSLLKLVLKTYPDAYDRLDEVLGSLKDRFSKNPPDVDAVKVIKKMLQLLATELKDPNILLDLQNYDGIIETLPFRPRRDVAAALCSTIVDTGITVNTLERVAKLFEIIAPMIKNVQDTPNEKSEIYTIDPEEEFVEEQSLVCRTVHMIDTDDVQVLFKMYSGIRKQLGQGGNERMVYTLKTIAALYQRLALRVNKLVLAEQDTGSLTPQKALQYLYSGDGKGIIEVLAVERPQAAFQLYLNAANCADVCAADELSYDLYTEAFTLYEENAANAADQMLMLKMMISSLCMVQNMNEENYDNVATKLCQYSSKLLKKHHQSRMAALCANLFWRKSEDTRIAQKVQECMQRALKISDHSQPQHRLALFVDLLNQFLHFYAAEVPTITAKFIGALIDLIREATSNADAAGGDDDEEEGAGNAATKKEFEEARAFYRNSTKYIRSRQKDEERWLEIDV
ncbi:vacuolar protein sorting-associated protein, putative [Bodo saltans]|uniref:Vacuolar protein sorting-associated protein 35 n=1 Tax=Bodo saltans TaxID=75058 RepID=A0A0S4JT07_BODSA|nr:vacuolar protein sorting-associated protein, putative [Bodo saltans]|eukprot:CUG91687.1 vacuolar protein sorting-associated protein, putative [Bodo saltans]